MIRLKRPELPDKAPERPKGTRGPKRKSLRDELEERQKKLDEELSEKAEAERSTVINTHWKRFRDADRKREGKDGVSVRTLLVAMCNKKCAYCEHEANEMDHHWPKGLHPEKTFDWNNLLLSCGICNNEEHKGHKIEFVEESGRKISKWIDPSVPSEDPYRLFVFMISKKIIDHTNPNKYNPIGWVDPHEGLSATQRARAEYTISELKLNLRDVIRRQREIVISFFVRLCNDLAEHGPDAIPGGESVRESFARLFARNACCRGPLRQVLRNNQALRDELLGRMPEIKEELEAWDLEPEPLPDDSPDPQGVRLSRADDDRHRREKDDDE